MDSKGVGTCGRDESQATGERAADVATHRVIHFLVSGLDAVYPLDSDLAIASFGSARTHEPSVRVVEGHRWILSSAGPSLRSVRQEKFTSMPRIKDRGLMWAGVVFRLVETVQPEQLEPQGSEVSVCR